MLKQIFFYFIYSVPRANSLIFHKKKNENRFKTPFDALFYSEDTRFLSSKCTAPHPPLSLLFFDIKPDSVGRSKKGKE